MALLHLSARSFILCEAHKHKSMHASVCPYVSLRSLTAGNLQVFSVAIVFDDRPPLPNRFCFAANTVVLLHTKFFAFFFSSTHFLFYVWLLLHNHNAEVYIFIAMQNFALYLCMFVLLRLLSSSSAFYLFLLPQHFSCARFYYRISFGHLRDRQRGLLHNYITTYILHIY